MWPRPSKAVTVLVCPGLGDPVLVTLSQSSFEKENKPMIIITILNLANSKAMAWAVKKLQPPSTQVQLHSHFHTAFLWLWAPPANSLCSLGIVAHWRHLSPPLPALPTNAWRIVWCYCAQHGTQGSLMLQTLKQCLGLASQDPPKPYPLHKLNQIFLWDTAIASWYLGGKGEKCFVLSFSPQWLLCLVAITRCLVVGSPK